MKDNTLLGILIWITGTIIALTVGSGMVDKTLTVSGIPEVITLIAGWVVVVGAIICVILAVFTK